VLAWWSALVFPRYPTRNNAPAGRAANRPATGNEKPGATGRAD
jgi:hypothetical protein